MVADSQHRRDVAESLVNFIPYWSSPDYASSCLSCGAGTAAGGGPETRVVTGDDLLPQSLADIFVHLPFEKAANTVAKEHIDGAVSSALSCLRAGKH